MLKSVIAINAKYLKINNLKNYEKYLPAIDM